MLRACRRVLRPGGRLAFTTIELPQGLTGTRRRHALQAGPRSVAARKPYLDILGSAGFSDTSSEDLTADYLVTARAWLTNIEAHYDEVVALDGKPLIDERIGIWRAAIDAIEAGLLERHLYGARRA